jgi:hypothetical protein
MGLDLYVGPLTRYHLGDWETIVQQSARAAGHEVRMVREGLNGNTRYDVDKVRAMVVGWRDKISKALGDKLPEPLSWDENTAGQYFTDKPAWDSYSDLVLWAAYDEHAEMARPRESVEKWRVDAALSASNDKTFKSQYGQLLKSVELWLPADFDFTFRAKDAVGNVINLGSSFALRNQLQTLNGRTWKADAATVQEWLQEGADEGAPLEEGARFAFSVFSFLAEQSVQHRLPMVLDY